MKNILLSLLIFVVIPCRSQIKVETRVLSHGAQKGFYIDGHVANLYQSPIPTGEQIDQLVGEDSLDMGSKTYRFATSIDINIDFLESANWITRGGMSYGRLLIVAERAKSLSLNFKAFDIPDLGELVIYNSKGTIAGQITAKENNSGQTWASPIFAGDSIWIEAKLPTGQKSALKLAASNIAYGYRKFDLGKSGFGESGGCLVSNNVVCFGNGWEFERNAVCLLVNQNGTRFCSGSMINNSCNNNIPYVLSANHCLPGAGDVGQWRFIFQYWSASCNPSQDDPNYIQFYGSTLRANASPSDFLLLQLNQLPDPTAGINYLGWDRTLNAATNGASIHHPTGDVMKISTFNSVVLRADNYLFANGKKAPGSQHWIVTWNNGLVEIGSSGAPLLNQSKKLVGQLAGGPSYCNAPPALIKDAYGRFDNSWTGLGTNATRLSNWLDPSGFGNTTTPSISLSHIAGSGFVCTTSSYSVANLQPGTSVVSWSSGNPAMLTINSAGTASRVGNANGQVTITATLNNGCGNFTRTKTVHVGKPVVGSINVDSDVCTGEGQDVVASLTGATSSSWAVTSANSFNATLMDNGNGIAYFNSYVQDCYGLQINVFNACGSVLDGTTICVNSCFGSLIAYPNPATDVVTFDFSNFGDGELPDQIQIFDEKSTAAKRSVYVNSNITDRKLLIDTHDLPRGTYYFHIIKNDAGGKVEKFRIVLE
ncbi:hypothetical protein SAMN05216327_12237 [Dyadobacter sp. SG02]|uniref:hypothetical protein n=1 Tax=Dyadobacter sp. SG02 TaxID=1855291 RepID=UPI0008CE29BC|nr:hypothetical protein [Dyadobacter sp. SG02]SEJ82709.1 hypothetical protein SAMN05216327_12237 [Dyadobacter sp. SG02]